MIPVLYELFPGIPPTTAAACSLATVFLNSTANTYNFIRADLKPRWQLVVLTAIPLSAGVTIGVNILHGFSQSTAKLTLALILIGVMMYRLVYQPESKGESESITRVSLSKGALIVVLALIGGVIAGISGLGGGFILIPIFLAVVQVPTKLVAPHTNVTVGIGALLGSLFLATHYHYVENPLADTIFEGLQFGHLNLGISLCIFISASITSRFGVKLIKKTSPATTKKLFIALISLMTLRLLTSL